MSRGTTMAAKYRARANTLTKKERKEYRSQAVSAIHGALKKIDLKKRTKKAKIKEPPVPTGMLSTAAALTPRSWCWPSQDRGLAEKQFKSMSLDEVFDLEDRYTANAGSGLKRRVMQLISPGGTILQAYKDRLGGQLKRALSDLEGLQELNPKVATAALKTFDSAQRALNWLTSPEISLKGRAPLKVSKTKKGVKEVITLLKRIDYGIAT